MNQMKMLSEGKEFQSKIKEARIQKGLTQQQVSDLTGVPFRSIQNWETGIRKCPDYVEKMVVNIINQTKLPYCSYCEDLDWLNAIVCYVPTDNGSATDIPVNYCPNCGTELNK
jgi:DNA-binding XRE family transcriptional regulator